MVSTSTTVIRFCSERTQGHSCHGRYKYLLYCLWQVRTFLPKTRISLLMASIFTIEYLPMAGTRIIFPMKGTWVFLFMTDTRTFLLMTDKVTLLSMTCTRMSLFMTCMEIFFHETKKDISFHDRYNNYMNASGYYCKSTHYRL
jgi:hypothetical protein